MRKPHTIRTTGKRPWPQAVVIVQCKVKQRYLGDADEVGHSVVHEWYACYGAVMGGSLDWREEGHGLDKRSFWLWFNSVITGHRHVWVYSWQAREVVAAIGLWDRLEDRTWTLEGADPYYRADSTTEAAELGRGFVVLESPPTIVCGRKAETVTIATWLDPQNYGVRDLGVYESMPDTENGAANKFAGELWEAGPTSQIVCYAVADFVQAYFRAVIGLDLGGPEHTAASQAMQAFRYKYMHDRIVTHNSEPAILLERAALYSGRCEARHIGTIHAGPRPGELPADPEDEKCVRWNQGPIYHLDVQAMYPSLAQNMQLPVKLQGVTGPVGWKEAAAAARVTGIIAAVRVECREPCVPVRLEDRTVWPTGKFDTVLCGPELCLLYAIGAKVQVFRSAIYETRPIYKAFVERLWRARQAYKADGNKQMAKVVKGILNAAFGKWAQVRRRWRDLPEADCPFPYYQWWHNGIQRRSLGWQVQELRVPGPGPFDAEPAESFPAITAYINSQARIYLWGLLSAAGRSNVYYYDTDSLFCNQHGYERLVASDMVKEDSLGLLSVKGVYHTLRIIGRQAYEADGKLVLSGLREQHRKVGDSYAEVLRAPPIGYYLREQEQPGWDRHIARIRTTRRYDLGNVGDDGSVTPPHFG